MTGRRGQNILVSICKNAIIQGIILLLISLLLILGGIFLGRHQDETRSDAGGKEILIMVFGEDLDSSSHKIDVYFNDCGEIDLGFNHVDDEKAIENIWVFIIAGMPFSWFVEGNTENRYIEYDTLDFSDMKSHKNELTSGESKGTAAFFITTDNDESEEAIHIRVDDEYAYCQKGDFVKITVPCISTLFSSGLDINDLDYLDDLEEFFQIRGVDIEKENAVGEYIFSVGKIDDMRLWPVVIRVSSVYRSEKFYKEFGYQLVGIIPNDYEKDAQTISWKYPTQQFLPSIQYRKTQNIFNYALFFIGGVLIPFSVKRIWCCRSKRFSAGK